ncbi:MAG: LD-carboxypeptidase [Deltaproteobacteria bacterium]|nr:LD-carboxypeptidase [Deltaproteobacteria bacterium]
MSMQRRGKKTIRPARLKPGDTVGIVAPAGPFDPEKFMKGKTVLESMGFQTFFDDGIFQKHGFLAGTDIQRADQVNCLFVDPAVQAIVCARGGYGSMRILSFLDFETIQTHPKIFLGFSDISALLSVLYDRCGLVTFHGPVVTTLANATEKTVMAMKTTLTSDAPIELTPEDAAVIKPGVCSGLVAGGNLTTLCHLVGTSYASNFKGKILLIEDVGEMPYRIDRMLTQMKLAGCFNGIAGVILGAFKECGHQNEIVEIFDHIFEDADIPILAGFDIGHGEHNLTIPMGLGATMDTESKRLLFHGPATTS